MESAVSQKDFERAQFFREQEVMARENLQFVREKFDVASSHRRVTVGRPEIDEVVSDVSHDMGEAAALEKDGVERDLQEALAGAPQFCGEGFRLVRREWPTDIGPVDLMCRDGADAWIAVEIKRIDLDYFEDIETE